MFHIETVLCGTLLPLTYAKKEVDAPRAIP